MADHVVIFDQQDLIDVAIRITKLFAEGIMDGLRGTLIGRYAA